MNNYQVLGLPNKVTMHEVNIMYKKLMSRYYLLLINQEIDIKKIFELEKAYNDIREEQNNNPIAIKRNQFLEENNNGQNTNEVPNNTQPTANTPITSLNQNQPSTNNNSSTENVATKQNNQHIFGL